jgi:hypothetical protein
MSSVPSAHQRPASAASIAPIRLTFSVGHADLLGEGAVVVEALQPEGALVARRQALQDDVGDTPRFVARAHRRVARHPVRRREPRGIGPMPRTRPTPPGTRHHWQFHQVAPLAAEHLARVGQHAGGGDIDDHLASAERWLGHLLDRQG